MEKAKENENGNYEKNESKGKRKKAWDERGEDERNERGLQGQGSGGPESCVQKALMMLPAQLFTFNLDSTKGWKEKKR